MSFVAEPHPFLDVARSSGSYDDRDLNLIQRIFAAAWRILCCRQICVEGGANEPDHRDLLARVTLDAFNDGEREVEPAARRCADDFVALGKTC